MSKRDDFIAALEGRWPRTAVPIWELEFQGWDAASGRHTVLGKEFEGLSAEQQEKTMYANAEILLSVSAEMNYAALSAPNGYWYSSPGQLAYYVMPGDTRFRQTQILRELAPKELVLVGTTGGIIAAKYTEEFCVRMFEEPQSIDADAERALAAGIELAKRFRDCGVDVVLTPSDIASNSGPFFNPQQMERWIYPHLERWSSAIHEMGMHCIMHTDGQVMPYVDRLATTGLNAIQAIDPTAGMDMRKTKDVVGNRLCLFGNIDCGRLLMGTPEEIYGITKSLLNACKYDGGLVLGASNAVQPEVPMENYCAMIEAWKKYGFYN